MEAWRINGGDGRGEVRPSEGGRVIWGGAKGKMSQKGKRPGKGLCERKREESKLMMPDERRERGTEGGMLKRRGKLDQIYWKELLVAEVQKRKAKARGASDGEAAEKSGREMGSAEATGHIIVGERRKKANRKICGNPTQSM